MRKIIFILVISINIAYSQNNGGQLFVIEEPAVLSLKFPLKYGTEWTSRSDSNVTVLKEVIGRETLAINGKDYDCLKIETKVNWTNPPNSVVEMHSWIAEEGLVKRVHFVITTYPDVNGSEYTTTYTDELILTDIDLK